MLLIKTIGETIGVLCLLCLAAGCGSTKSLGPGTPISSLGSLGYITSSGVQVDLERTVTSPIYLEAPTPPASMSAKPSANETTSEQMQVLLKCELSAFDFFDYQHWKGRPERLRRLAEDPSIPENMLDALRFFNSGPEIEPIDHLATPSLLVWPGQTAAIHIGQEHQLPITLPGGEGEPGETRPAAEGVAIHILVETNARLLAAGEAPTSVVAQVFMLLSEAVGTAHYEWEMHQADHPIIGYWRIESRTELPLDQFAEVGVLHRQMYVEFEDKLPILGHIPLLGRLFTSKGQRLDNETVALRIKASLKQP